GPVAGARIGMIDGQLVVNPTISQMANSILDLRVSGTETAINMIECAATEVDEETMLKAFKLAHESIQSIIAVINQMREQIGKPKATYDPAATNATLSAEVSAKATERVRQIIIEKTEREGRNEALEELREEIVAVYQDRNEGLTDPEEEIELGDAREAFSEVI